MLEDKKELLPVILCGDFNSVATSHLYKFITSSFLDYSDISAVEVAGYHRRKRGHHRVIPCPLFPSSMAIGNDCLYRGSQAQQPRNDTQRQQSIEKSGGNVREEQGLLSKPGNLKTEPNSEENQGSQSKLNTHRSTSEANPAFTAYGGSKKCIDTSVQS